MVADMHVPRTRILANERLHLGGAGKLVKVTYEDRPVKTFAAPVLIVEADAVIQSGHGHQLEAGHPLMEERCERCLQVIEGRLVKRNHKVTPTE